MSPTNHHIPANERGLLTDGTDAEIPDRDSAFDPEIVAHTWRVIAIILDKIMFIVLLVFIALSWIYVLVRFLNKL